jgi:GntR family transcriptional regulator
MENVLNKNNNKTIPLYRRIVKILKKEIQEGKYEVGALLPTEEQLIKRFSASRTTIRNAIGVLQKERYVFKKQGKGSIIQEWRTVQHLNHVTSFTETMKNRGYDVKTGFISLDIILPSPYIASTLNISRDEDIYFIQRSRIVNEIPIAINYNYVLRRVVPELERYKQSIQTIGLYTFYERQYNLEIGSAVDTISAYNSGPVEDNLLNVKLGTALLINKRITYLKNGSAFEYVVSIVRPDMYEYSVYLESRPPEG